MSRPPTPRPRREVQMLSSDFSLFIHAPNGPDVQLQTLELCVSFPAPGLPTFAGHGSVLLM